MDRTWLDDRGSLLTDRCPLPLDEPFTRAQATALGVSRRSFEAMLRSGLIRRVLHEVYAVAQAPDDVTMRTTAVALILPAGAVVVDRTAAWLHGVDILPRTSLTQAPPLDVVHTTDTRMRRPETDGRRRGLLASDVVTVEGVPVTTAVRTALDLGRLLWRFDALAALDGFLRQGVAQDLLIAEVGRFRRYRGVRQLRALAPLADARAESPGESALRLHWIDAELPRPELQIWIFDDEGTPLFRLDIGDPECRYAAEYDGEEHHSSDDDREHDVSRRTWIRDNRAWTIDVFGKKEVYGPRAYPIPQLRAGHDDARRSVSIWTPRRRS